VFANEFERPGLDASDRLIRGQQVNRDDWERIIGFVALQHLRTPQSFFEAMERWEATLPDVLGSTSRESLARIEQAKRQGEKLTAEPESTANGFAGLIDVQIDRNPDPRVGGAVVRTEVVMGRRLWLASIRYLLTGSARKLLEHQWSVWEPAPGSEWPMTDDPSLRLNYYAADNYDFGGGWGKRGSELMMPISPRHLLYTQVGRPSRRRITASSEHTRAVQQILVRRAYRWIFGTQPYDWVSQARSRVVDQERYDAERQMWTRWHEEQTQSETSRQPPPS
jgi:hypothetical protein